jgi:tetratricopeptide (TPR) repeat protein
VLESGVPSVGIPTTLHDSLLARLDRLGSVRQVAQIGASIGRHFSYGLVHAVSRLPEDELRAALGRLVASELVFQRGTPPDALYSFKHALVQDAAHNSLLRNVRQQLHAQIAEALETRSPELMDSQPELFAQHYAQAGLVEKSVAYWGKSGHSSAARSAMAEAAAQFQKGLNQLALLPETRERQLRELEFCSALGAALTAAKGQAAPETGHAHARSRELWEQLGSPSEFLRVPYQESAYHAFRGELDLALRLAEDLLRLSRQRNDSVGLVLGHLSSGRALLLSGKFASSRSHLEQVLALSDQRSLFQRVAAVVISRALLGIVLFCLGHPDQALARSNRAIAEGRRLGLVNQGALAGSLSYGTMLLSLVGDNAVQDEWVEQLVLNCIEERYFV